MDFSSFLKAGENVFGAEIGAKATDFSTLFFGEDTTNFLAGAVALGQSAKEEEKKRKAEEDARNKKEAEQRALNASLSLSKLPPLQDNKTLYGVIVGVVVVVLGWLLTRGKK